jgi:hypothetical protein
MLFRASGQGAPIDAKRIASLIFTTPYGEGLVILRSSNRGA